MKKLYTLALAALVCLGANADVVKSKTFAKETATFVNDTKAVNLKKSAKKVAAKEDALEIGDLSGEYVNTYYLFAGTSYSETVKLELQEDGTYLLKGLFWGEAAKDIPCTVTTVDIQFTDGVYTFPVLTIAGKGTVVGYTKEGVDYSMYLGEYGADGFHTYTNDIQYLILDDGFVLMYNLLNDTDEMGVAYIQGQSGLCFTDPKMFVANGAMTWVSYDEEDNPLANECKVYAVQEESSLVVIGLTEFPAPMEFVLDFTNNTATATDQVVMQYLYSKDNTLYDFKAFDFINEEYVLHASFTTVDETTEFTIDNELWGGYVAGLGYWTYNSGGTITLPFKLADPAGVSNVTVDNSNAPVEYFNLQGVRVANPENGLYIRRQGNTATKVLVK